MAKEWGVPPLKALGSPLARNSWTEADRMLAHAYTLDTKILRCPCGCGGYSDVTLTSDGWHEVETVICDAKRAMDEHRKESEPEPGEVAYPVFVEN